MRGDRVPTDRVPLSPRKRQHIERHFEMLQALPARFPHIPAPRALHAGTVAGVWLTCERRLGGWTAPQRSGDQPRIERMLTEASAHFAKLVVREPRALTRDDFEREIGARIDFAARFAAVPQTLAWLSHLRADLERRLVGRRLPRVLRHSDLRAKHVQIDLDGRVLGYLDWGTGQEPAIPYFDLLHLLVHERKQSAGLSTGDGWRIVCARDELRPFERAALESYLRALDLDDDTARALEELYPAFVADMAESNWDYSRPRWLHRQFGI